MFLMLGHYIIHLRLLMVSAIGRPSVPMMDPNIIQSGPVVIDPIVSSNEEWSLWWATILFTPDYRCSRLAGDPDGSQYYSLGPHCY